MPLTFRIGSIWIGFLCSRLVTQTCSHPLLYFLWSYSRHHSSSCPSACTPVPSPFCYFEALYSTALAPASEQSEPFFCLLLSLLPCSLHGRHSACVFSPPLGPLLFRLCHQMTQESSPGHVMFAVSERETHHVPSAASFHFPL